MKICILSMQHVPNFGSLLQCYGLKQMVEALGHSVSFLDIAPNESDNRLMNHAVIQFHNEGEAWGSFFSKLKKLDRYTFARIHQKLLWKAQERKFEAFRRQHLPAAGTGEQFDCCIIGSDEVFNCMNGSPWGFTSQLFGNVPQAAKVITYAASCGSTAAEALPLSAAERIREALGSVSALSVRDENTNRFVSQLTGRDVLEHMDPVLVADFEHESASVQLPEDLPGRYCIVYSYYNRICDQQSIRQIRKFCKTHGMHLLTVGAPQKWIPDHRVMMPFEMLKLFQNASFIITDTFHGTIFSAKYAEKFAVMIRSSNCNKLGDLVTRLALEPHVVKSFDSLEAAYSVSNDPERIEALTEQARSHAFAYLRENLAGDCI